MIASAGKRVTEVAVGECYAYVGGSGGVIKSRKWRMLGEKVAKRTHLWRKSNSIDALGPKKLPTSVFLLPPGGPESRFLA